jgi:hypothetical protein
MLVFCVEETVMIAAAALALAGLNMQAVGS